MNNIVTLLAIVIGLGVLGSIAAIIAAFALTPLREKYSLQEYAALRGHCGQLISVAGRQLYCETHGPLDGTPVLLLHGFAASTFTWRHQWPALVEAGYRVIALDHLGFGGSERVAGPVYSTQSHAELALAAMTALNLPQAIIIGHSYGARVAMQMALYAPARVRAIVAIAPEAFATRRPKIASWVRVPLFGYALVYYSTAPAMVRPGLRYVSGSEGWLTPDVVTGYAQPLSVRGHIRAQQWNSFSPKDGLRPVPENLAEIQQPALFIWGADDNVFPVGDADRLVKIMPQAQAEVFAGVGHLPHEEQPQQTNVVMLDFLARLASQTARGSA